MLKSFLHQGKKATYFLCVNQPFEAIWSGKNFHNFFSIFEKVDKNHLKREKKFIFFIFYLLPGSGSAKKMWIRNPDFGLGDIREGKVFFCNKNKTVSD